MRRTSGFIARHDLWTTEQRRRAVQIKKGIDKEGLKLFRVVWTDTHGAARAKTLTVPAFLGALEEGYNINVATTTLDASGARTFSSFTRGGGMGLEEMTGSPNLTIVPDLTTFRVLPWEPTVGWVLCDEYFVNGVPFYFSPRQLLRRQVEKLAKRSFRSVIGLEIEWYLLRVAQDHLDGSNIGSPGVKGAAMRTYPAEPGYSLHSETNMDLMQPAISALADALQALELPLRSIENEWGPGQLECTFAPRDALEAADNVVLFRTATRQLCRRMGFLASFMCRPALKGYYSSGWHLHQSLTDAKTGRNLFAPKSSTEPLSPLGKSYLGGLMKRAEASTVFANPTVNAYRRFRANSLAPDRIVWGTDHRGVMLRVLSAPGSSASRIENRGGEPSANPYLYVASQIVAGIDGIDNKRDPGPAETDPYATAHQMLPKSLSNALKLMENEPLFRDEFGPLFVDYYLKIKRTEVGRFEADQQKRGVKADGDEPTEWEQNEYFDFF